MGIFLTIIYDSFSQVKNNTENQSNDYEIVDFMIGKLKHMFGMDWEKLTLYTLHWDFNNFTDSHFMDDSFG